MAVRGRKPKPTATKRVTGNPGRRRLNKKEPKFKPSLPAPPAHLSAEAKTEWKRVGPALFKSGLLVSVDRAALACYCQAYGRWVQAERAIKIMAAKDKLTSALMISTKSGNAIQNPLVGTANKAMSDMVRFAAEFGMTPSARSRISSDPPPLQDEEARETYY